jgi:aspartyl protease family protein
MVPRMLKTVIAVALAAIVLALTAPQLAMRLIEADARTPVIRDTDGGAGQRGRVTLAADRSGHYRTTVTLNGRTLPVVVDTGATVIALRHEDARNLGLVSAADRYDVPVQTANGVLKAKRLQLASVRLGGIVVRDVDAMAVPEGALAESLLGMSFLGRLHRMEASGGRLVLEE